jgi:DNA repair exonuclease SbcCD ATPase subunit
MAHVVSAASTLFNLCKEVRNLIKEIATVDERLGQLNTEVEELSNVLKDVEEVLKKASNAGLQPERELEYQDQIYTTREDCEATLEELREFLMEIKRKGSGNPILPRRAGIWWAEDKPKVDLYQKKLSTYHRTMEMYLQVKTMYLLPLCCSELEANAR